MTDFVFSRFYNDLGIVQKNIINYFDKFEIYNSNVYQILDQIPNYNIIYYFIIVGVIFFILNFYDITIKHVFILLISVLIIGFLIQKDYGDFNTYVSHKKDQLNFINKLCFDGQNYKNFGPNDDMNVFPTVQKSYIYRNPLIVEFYYNIREFTQYNLSSYVSSVLHTNNVMRLHNQVKLGLENPYQNLDIMKSEMTKSLNALESTIYKAPQAPIALNKLKNSVDALQSLLLNYIVEVEQLCQKKNKDDGVNYYIKPDDQLNSQFEVAANDINTRDYNPAYNLFVE